MKITLKWKRIRALGKLRKWSRSRKKEKDLGELVASTGGPLSLPLEQREDDLGEPGPATCKDPVPLAEAQPDPPSMSAPEASIETAPAPGFQLFPKLPPELRAHVWKCVAEQTTQVIQLVPHTTGTNRRNFSFTGAYYSKTRRPNFLYANRESYTEAMRHYKFLKGNLANEVLFNYERDVLFLGFDLLGYSRLLALQGVRSVLNPESWDQIQNIGYQVDTWIHFPQHLRLLDELKNLKEIHFTTCSAAKYAHHVEATRGPDMMATWPVKDCRQLLGIDNWGRTDFGGFDDFPRNRALSKVKLEFLCAQSWFYDALAIRVIGWKGSSPPVASG